MSTTILPYTGVGAQSIMTSDEVVAKLETLRALLAQLAGYEDGVEGFVDGLEGLMGSAVTLLTTQNTYLDQVESKLDTLNAAVADTTPAAVTQSGTWAINLGTIGLAATEATLLALSAKQPTLGQKAAGGSVSFIESSGTTLALAAKQDLMQATLDASLALKSAGYTLTTGTYASPGAITLAAGASSATTTVTAGGYFFFDATFTGTSPSLKLQRRAPDGTTWIDVVTVTVPGAAANPVGIPNGAVLRLTNGGANSLSAVSAVLG